VVTAAFVFAKARSAAVGTTVELID